MVRRAEYQITAKHVHSYAHAPHMWRFIASELTSLSPSLSRAHTHTHVHVDKHTHVLLQTRLPERVPPHAMRIKPRRFPPLSDGSRLASAVSCCCPAKETIASRTKWSYLNLRASEVISRMADFLILAHLLSLLTY